MEFEVLRTINELEFGYFFNKEHALDRYNCCIFNNTNNTMTYLSVKDSPR